MPHQQPEKQAWENATGYCSGKGVVVPEDGMSPRKWFQDH